MRHPSIHDLATLPNVISVARVPIALAFPLTKTTEGALALIGAASLTDLLDGWSARKLGQSTIAGALIDGFADKAFAASLLATLVVRGRLTIASALLLATRELLELPLAIRVLASPTAQGLPIDRGSNAFGKLATTLELLAVVAALRGSRRLRPLVVAAGIAGACAGLSYWAREIRAHRKYVNRHVPYLLAGGRPEVLAQIAA